MIEPAGRRLLLCKQSGFDKLTCGRWSASDWGFQMTRDDDSIIDDLEKAFGENFGCVSDGGQIVHLRLNGTKIRTVPAGCCNLRHLQLLDLSLNAIKYLPADLSKLEHLRVLDLSNNKLKVFPRHIEKVQSLRELTLRHNHIRTIPPDIAQMTNLTALSLGANCIDDVPQELGYLSRLTHLNLSHNNIKRLPATIGSLHNLKELLLDGNPLAEPFAELSERGLSHLLTYLKSLSDGIPQYEARLLVVGEGNVGKSCLVDALAGKPFLKDRPTTHGIQLGTLHLSHPDSTVSVDVTLNTWDFGGQELYRITNQFFYSKRSLYMLVWRPREGAEESALDGWLERIRLRVSQAEAKVLIVATYGAERRADVDEAGLRAKFGNMIAGFYVIDNKTRKGIGDLKNAIAQVAAQLPQMGHLMSQSWILARDEVCNRTETHITRKEFDRICNRYHLNKASRSTLADLMHDLGRFIHYSGNEGLQDLIVLQPEWLTRAISFVLEDRTTSKDKGVLDHNRLQLLWNDMNRPVCDRYKARLHPYFLRLMEQFDISYRYDNGKQSLIGQMVPFERPSVLPHDRKDRHLSLVYALEQDPPGLIPWLIVRTHRFSKDIHWRRGMVLEHQGHSGIIVLNPQNLHLDVSVWGSAPEYLFHVLVDIIDQVIERWPGLTYNRLVSCRSSDCNKSDRAGYFALASLQKARQVGRTTIQCHECLHDRDVAEMLTGFQTSNQFLSEDLRDMLERVKQDTSAIREDTTHISNVLSALRRIHKAVTSELREAPGLFTVWPSAERSWMGRIDPAKIGMEEYELWLWCDHLEYPHPVKKYTFRKPKTWLLTVMPYANLIATALKLTLPIAGAMISALTPTELVGKLEKRVESIRKVAESLKGELDVGSRQSVDSSGLSVVEGAGLRAFHSLLTEFDVARDWGKLRFGQTTAGDVHWACPAHYKEYDPGLPDLGYVSNEQR